MADPAIPDFLSALKLSQWERAKGELRALAAMQGSYSGSNRRPDETAPETERWERLNDAILVFIQKVEDDGLHE